MQVDTIKRDFPIFKTYPDLVYLDSAATSQKPQVVIDAIVDFYTKYNSNVHRGIYKLSELATERYEAARSTVARFLDTSPGQIVFTSGTTASNNIVANSYVSENLDTDSVVITSVSEHHSNFLPLQKAANATGAKLEFVGITADYDFDYETFEALLSKYTSRIKFVGISAISNVLGYKLDLERVIKMVRSFAPEAKISLDAAQLIGHHPFSLSKLDIDFCFFSGHKVLAETGLGVLWFKSNLAKSLKPTILGGGTITEVKRDSVSFRDDQSRFEAGTPHISGAISLATACDYLEAISLEKIEQQQHELTSFALRHLAEIPEVKLLGPGVGNQRSSVISFQVKGLHPHDVAESLDHEGIAVRAGHHCAQILHREYLDLGGTVRVSAHIYNDKTDIERLVAALKNCISTYTHG